MAATPYSPMGKPEKHVTQQQMWETLAKRAKPQVAVRPETQSPQAKAPLEWKEPVWTSDRGNRGSGYLETVCGRFTISRTEHELGYSYSAWRREAEFPPTSLGVVSNLDEAKKLCEAAR